MLIDAADANWYWLISTDDDWCWLWFVRIKGQCVNKLLRIGVSKNQVEVFIKWSKSFIMCISCDTINQKHSIDTDVYANIYVERC